MKYRYLRVAPFYAPAALLFVISIICFFFYNDLRWEVFQGSRWQEGMMFCLTMIFTALPRKAQNRYTAPVFVAVMWLVHYMTGNLSYMAEFRIFSVVKLLVGVVVAVQMYRLAAVVFDEVRDYRWLVLGVIAIMASVVFVGWNDDILFHNRYPSTTIKTYYIHYLMGVVALFSGILEFLIVRLDGWFCRYGADDVDDD